MTSIVLHEGDNRVALRRLIDQGVRVHSVVTDPPYHLESITKRFGKESAAPAKFGSDGAFARSSRGFMGSQWDGADASGVKIAFDPEFWRLIHDILLPGGYVVAFSGSRTGHWQACAMEMAGFIMHPFLGWVFGQGFPKAHAAKRGMEVGSPEAAQWDGWAYGGQALKPAIEPIFVGQKPFSEKNGALNILKHGVGAINIDGCRVPTTGEGRERHGEPSQDRRYTENGSTNFSATPGPRGGSPDGRHPANLLHDGSDEVVALFPESGGQRGALKGHNKERQSPNGTFGTFGAAHDCEPRNDSGSAARFFNSFPLDADPIFYQGKASKADRAGSKHPTVKPVALMQWLVRLVTPAGGITLDPFAGSGTTGEAARREGFDCILMEAEEQFIGDIRRRFGLPGPVADFDDFDALLEDDFEALL